MRNSISTGSGKLNGSQNLSSSTLTFCFSTGSSSSDSDSPFSDSSSTYSRLCSQFHFPSPFTSLTSSTVAVLSHKLMMKCHLLLLSNIQMLSLNESSTLLSKHTDSSMVLCLSGNALGPSQTSGRRQSLVGGSSLSSQFLSISLKKFAYWWYAVLPLVLRAFLFLRCSMIAPLRSRSFKSDSYLKAFLLSINIVQFDVEPVPFSCLIISVDSLKSSSWLAFLLSIW